eukprot:RCo047742
MYCERNFEDGDGADYDRLKMEKCRIEQQLAEATRTSMRTKKVLDALMTESTSFHMSCRIRPLSDEEVYRRQYNVLRADPASQTVELLEMRNEHKLQVHFDEVFDSTDPSAEHYANQRIVYERVGKPLLDFAVHGFNVTLIGFGQTASGKTYTLVGDNVDRGIVPRLLTHLFEIIAEKRHSCPQECWRLEMDAIEVYNERIYNLLEGIDNEDGVLRMAPAPCHPLASRPSRFNRGTFADMEREQLARGRRGSTTASATATGTAKRGTSFSRAGVGR